MKRSNVSTLYHEMNASLAEPIGRQLISRDDKEIAQSEPSHRVDPIESGANIFFGNQSKVEFLSLVRCLRRHGREFAEIHHRAQIP